MKYAIFEILEKVAKARSRDEKIQILRENYSQPLATILKYALDPNIKWLLPKGPVPYKPSNSDEKSVLYKEARRLYLFIEGGHPNLQQAKREKIFIQIMEELHPGDAKLLEQIKDGKMPHRSITAELVNLAFPGLIDVKDPEIQA